MDAMRPVLLGLTLATSFVLLTFLGCGGAEEQDVLDAPASSSGGGGSLTSGTSTSGSSGETTSSTSSGSGTSSGATTGDSGKGPPDGCERESEPNDEPGDANVLSTSLCGTLAPESETDYLTFELGPDTKSMHLTFEGDIEMRVFVGGRDPATLSPDKNDEVPFVIGEPYVIEVRARGGSEKGTYRVNLIRS